MDLEELQRQYEALGFGVPLLSPTNSSSASRVVHDNEKVSDVKVSRDNSSEQRQSLCEGGTTKDNRGIGDPLLSPTSSSSASRVVHDNEKVSDVKVSRDDSSEKRQSLCEGGTTGINGQAATTRISFKADLESPTKIEPDARSIPELDESQSDFGQNDGNSKKSEHDSHDLDELQRQFDALDFSQLGGGTSSSNSARQRPAKLSSAELKVRDSAGTPDSASTATATVTTPAVSIGGIDAFALYQKFRLQMVKMFGSLASALFELGGDPHSGKISRATFEEVLADRLQLFTRVEANALFEHATNADPMDLGQGGYASFRDFSISEEEWRMVVAAKRSPSRGGRDAMPFASGPTGTSLGIYHRPVTMEQVLSPTKESSQQSTFPQNAEECSPSRQAAQSRQSKQSARSGPRKLAAKSGERIWPWRSPQKPWEPSIMSGEAFPESVRDHIPKSGRSRSRDSEVPFRSIKKAPFKPYWDYSILGPSSRPQCWLDEAAGHLVPCCPSRRSEMEPKACVRQIRMWWPYARPAPLPRLKTMLPKQGKLAAQPKQVSPI